MFSDIIHYIQAATEV